MTLDGPVTPQGVTDAKPSRGTSALETLETDPRQGASPQPRKGIRLLILSSVWLALSALLAYTGYYATYSFFGSYDDDGYWLIALRSYHLHGSLYHNTYAQAGPFYYEFWSLVYSAVGLPINWDSGRLLTLAVWIAASLLMGIAIWVLSERLLLGLLAEVVSFLVLYLLCGVAMEPAGLAHFMGAAVLLGLAFLVRGRRTLGIGIIGVASTALLFTKVNVGVFMMAGLVATVAIFWPSRELAIARKVVVAIGIVALPIVLMEQVLGASWARNYCLLELIYLVGFLPVLLTRQIPTQAFTARDGLVGLSAAAGSGILIAAGVLINGTSLGQLLSGVFGQRGLARVGHTALPITSGEVVVAIVSSVLAITVAAHTVRQHRLPGWLNSRLPGYLRLAAGIWILVTISEAVFSGWNPSGLVLAPSVTVPVPGQSFLLAAPFAWLGMLGGKTKDQADFAFARTAICLVAVLGCMEGFPVAGSQWSWGSLTLVPVGFICIMDGLSIIPRSDRDARRMPGRVSPVPLGALVTMALLLVLMLGSVGQTLSNSRHAYFAQEPVNLPGAHRVHLPASQVMALRQTTAAIKSNCSTFWSAPGLNSFYFFSGETPPTGLNSSQNWWDVFSFKQQNEILARLRQIPRLCIVEDFNFVGRPYHGFGAIQTPLIQYMEDDFVRVKVVNNFYELLVRPSAPAPCPPDNQTCHHR